MDDAILLKGLFRPRPSLTRSSESSSMPLSVGSGPSSLELEESA